MADNFDKKNNDIPNELDENAIKNLKKGGAKKMISKLSKEDKQKLMDTISDKEALEKILSTPQAKRLMELFMGGKK